MLTPPAPVKALRISRSAGVDDAVSRLLLPPTLSVPSSTSTTGPAARSVEPPPTLTLRKQYVPAASVTVRPPPLTVRSPAALYVKSPAPLMPAVPLNGVHGLTASGASGSVGEFCVAV